MHSKKKTFRSHGSFRPLVTAISLALVSGQVGAATINVAAGIVDDTDNQCSLIEAIENANSTTTGQPNTDCAAGDPMGSDDVSLAASSVYTLTSANNGINGLPSINSEVSIQGNGAMIERNSMDDFRLLHVSPTGNLAIDNLTLSNGLVVKARGGGIYNSGELTLTDSTVSGNSAGDGGGIFNGGTGNPILRAYNSTISGNTGNYGGGGIYNEYGMASLTNSTVSGNSSSFFGGGILNRGFYQLQQPIGRGPTMGLLSITNSTISENTALYGGGGLYNTFYGYTTLSNSIIANSTMGGDCLNDPMGFGMVTDTSSLIEDGSCSPTFSGDPNLGSLTDNGGPTLTHALLVPSSAIDMGDQMICDGLQFPDMTPITTDQRGAGFSRTANGACDIGAIELQVPTLSLSTMVDTVNEGGTLMYNAVLDFAVSYDVVVDFSTVGSGADPAEAGDFAGAAFPVGQITIPMNSTSMAINLVSLDDVIDEADEGLTLSINNAMSTVGPVIDGTPQTAAGTLQDNDSATLTIDDVMVTEGDAGTTPALFTVSLSIPSAFTVGVNFASADGSAGAGADYNAVSSNLTFAPGETEQNITVDVLGDLIDELDETFVVNLSAPSNASLTDDQGQGTILDDDLPPALAIDDRMVNEGATATFNVSLSGPSGLSVTVNFASADGSAAAADDYNATSGGLTFTPGQTSQTIMVDTIDDLIDELDETFLVNLSAPGNASLADDQGQGTIVDDDLPPALSIDDTIATEGTTATFTVSLSTPSGLLVMVDFTTADGSAMASLMDYTPTFGALSFAPGEQLQTIPVEVLEDNVFESADEIYVVNLSQPTNATLADPQGEGLIPGTTNCSPRCIPSPQEMARTLCPTLRGIEFGVEDVLENSGELFGSGPGVMGACVLWP